jgi:hypothetical protein
VVGSVGAIGATVETLSVIENVGVVLTGVAGGNGCACCAGTKAVEAGVDGDVDVIVIAAVVYAGIVLEVEVALHEVQ